MNRSGVPSAVYFISARRVTTLSGAPSRPCTVMVVPVASSLNGDLLAADRRAAQKDRVAGRFRCGGRLLGGLGSSTVEGRGRPGSGPAHR